MFGFFKSKKERVVSPVDGDILELSAVPDEVFSQKMAGDGVAIVPRSNTFVAPISGVVSKIFSTNHAFSIRSEMGVEVLVHIGLDTVELNGQGFERLLEEGSKVKVGQPIINVDLEFIQSQGKEIITPIVLNHEKALSLSIDNVKTIREGELLIEVVVK